MTSHNELIPTRNSLLNRLKDWGDQASWSDFFDTYWKLIYGVASKAGLSDAEAQDVVQETLLSVAKTMPGFNYNPEIGSFKSYLLTLTRWRILDQLRRRGQFPSVKQDHDLTRTEFVEQLIDSSGCEFQRVWDQEWETNLLNAALEKVRRRANPKHFQLFDLYVRKGWSVQEVTQTMEVSVHQVYTAKSRIASMLKKEIEDLRRLE